MKRRASYFSIFSVILLAVGLWLFSTGCVSEGRRQVYQKNTAIPDHEWRYDFKPSFTFNIKDTAALYDIFITIRHTNAYPYSNLWLLIYSNYEGVKPKSQRVELPLADKTGKWLGSGMGDIFEHRIPIQQDARFDKAGTYHFTLEQNMRINPLPHVMSIGLRIEKTSP